MLGILAGKKRMGHAQVALQRQFDELLRDVLAILGADCARKQELQGQIENSFYHVN